MRLYNTLPNINNKRPSLKWKNWSKQLLGSLPLEYSVFALGNQGPML